MTTSAVYGEVERTEWLTPGMVRVVLGGAGLDDFEPTAWTDQYVNALFVPDGAGYDVPFDPAEARNGPPEHRPVGRRYTVRAWDPEARHLTIDFVAHGDSGMAGPWAQRARPGDRLQVVGPSGGYRPDPDAPWYLMAGDESAIPAIAASLEQVPAGRDCFVFLVVDDERHELPLDTPGELRCTWLHRLGVDAPAELLVGAVAAATFPAGHPDVFVHGEAGEIRAVRRHLLADRGIERDQTSISPYWRRRHTDEAWREVKAEWLAEVAQDV
ncbi:MAG: siderophore-interacting protein [Actinomycetota bacterium]